MKTLILIALWLCIAPVTWATDLDGGTETITIGPDNGAGESAVSVTLTNKTKRPIHDLIVKIIREDGAPPNINEAKESDTSMNTDFDVDDNGNNSLDAGETGTANPEPAGSADNQPSPASSSVRMINSAGSPDITNNDTFGLDLRLSGPLVAGDKIKVTPTSTTNLPILAAVAHADATGDAIGDATVTQVIGGNTLVTTTSPNGLVVAATPDVALAEAEATATVSSDLDGGTETVDITADNGAGFKAGSFTFTNKLRRDIHDFIIEILPHSSDDPITIEEVKESDTNGNTDFDVDDDGSEAIEPGEDAAGHGAEGSGHADNKPTAPASKVRTINTGTKEIGPGETFGLDITFSRPLVAGDRLKVTPTSTSNLPMLTMVSGNLRGAGLVALDAAHLLMPQGTVLTRNDLGVPLTSIKICSGDIPVTFLGSETQGAVGEGITALPRHWFKDGKFIGVDGPSLRAHAQLIMSKGANADGLILKFPEPVPAGEKFSFEFALGEFNPEGGTLIHVIGNPDEAGNDADGDGVPDCYDNCPNVANPDQMGDPTTGVGEPCSSGEVAENPFGGTQGSGASTPSAADTNRIDIVYNPDDSDTSSPCEKIYFIQVMVILIDGNPVDPGDFRDDWSYRDEATLDDGTHVDRLSGRTEPYYGGNGAGTGHSSPGSRNGHTTNATMDDSPYVNDGRFMPGGADVATGHDYNADTITFKFETCAFCAAGEDIGDFFDCITWEYTRTRADAASGSRGTSTVTDSNSGGPSESFMDAVNAWDDAHEDFNLPGR